MQNKNQYHHGQLRDTLIDAAEQELIDVGVEGFSLRSVAKRGGVSPAAPSHHFGDVKGLLTAVATEGFERFLKALKDSRPNTSDTTEVIVSASLAYVEFALANSELFRLIFSSSKPIHEDPDLTKASNEAFEYLAEMVQDHTGLNPFSSGDAMTDVLSLWATVHGIADLLVAGRMKPIQAMSKKDRDRTIREMITRSLKLQ